MNSTIYQRSDHSLFTIILIIFCLSILARSEPSGELFQHNYKIAWIAEYSSNETFTTNENLISRFFNFITGEDVFHLQRPMSVIASRSGQITVLDQEARSIVCIDPLNKKMDLISATSATPFPSLLALCLNNNNEIYLTDSHDNQIYFLTSPDEDPVILNKSLQLRRPTGIAYHQQNKEIWVVETAAHRISIIDQLGNHIRYIGKRGLKEGEFNFPSFIWIDRMGTAYVIDTMNFRIQILDGEGNTISVFGEAGDGSGYFARPKGIATDSEGNIYIVDALFHAVQIFDINGNFLFSFGKQGQGKSEFWMPSGIYIDEMDKIYIADSYNSRIQIFQLLKKGSGEN